LETVLAITEQTPDRVLNLYEQKSVFVPTYLFLATISNKENKKVRFEGKVGRIHNLFHIFQSFLEIKAILLYRIWKRALQTSSFPESNCGRNIFNSTSMILSYFYHLQHLKYASDFTSDYTCAYIHYYMHTFVHTDK
jgi:hypothetical protein